MAGDASGYSTRPFLTIRRAYLDVLDAGRRKRMIHGLIEVDVTRAKWMIRQSQQDISFTAYVMWAVAQAVIADRTVHAYRQGRRLVIFDDVDINTQIEVEESGQKIVKSHLFRAVNTKSVAELSAEMRRAQRPDDSVGRQRYQGARAFAALPGFVRGLPWRIAMGNPFLFRRFGGTVGLSSLGMFAHGGWGIPIAPPTLMVTAGGVTRKPRFVDGVLSNRELLSLTLSFDHAVVDGAPAARFASRLTELIEAAAGLDETGARSGDHRP